MTVTAHTMQGYQVEIKAGRHTLVSDEPQPIGDDAGPGPFELVLAGLVSCTVITLQMYARRKNWPLERVDMRADIRSVEERLENGSKTRRSIIDTHITFHGPLSHEQMERLEEIASHCPVHRALKGSIEINSKVSNLSGTH